MGCKTSIKITEGKCMKMDYNYSMTQPIIALIKLKLELNILLCHFNNLFLLKCTIMVMLLL